MSTYVAPAFQPSAFTHPHLERDPLTSPLVSSHSFLFFLSSIIQPSSTLQTNKTTGQLSKLPQGKHTHSHHHYRMTDGLSSSALPPRAHPHVTSTGPDTVPLTASASPAPASASSTSQTNTLANRLTTQRSRQSILQEEDDTPGYELQWSHLIHAEIISVTSAMRRNSRWSGMSVSGMSMGSLGMNMGLRGRENQKDGTYRNQVRL